MSTCYLSCSNLQFGHLDHIICFQLVNFLTSTITLSKLNSHLGDIYNTFFLSFIFNFKFSISTLLKLPFTQGHVLVLKIILKNPMPEILNVGTLFMDQNLFTIPALSTPYFHCDNYDLIEASIAVTIIHHLPLKLDCYPLDTMHLPSETLTLVQVNNLSSVP